MILHGALEAVLLWLQASVNPSHIPQTKKNGQGLQSYWLNIEATPWGQEHHHHPHQSSGSASRNLDSYTKLNDVSNEHSYAINFETIKWKSPGPFKATLEVWDIYFKFDLIDWHHQIDQPSKRLPIIPRSLSCPLVVGSSNTITILDTFHTSWMVYKPQIEENWTCRMCISHMTVIYFYKSRPTVWWLDVSKSG